MSQSDLPSGAAVGPGNADPADRAHEMSIDSLPEEWRVRLRNLEGCICELLIKNERLRMALRESVERMKIAEEPNG